MGNRTIFPLTKSGATVAISFSLLAALASIFFVDSFFQGAEFDHALPGDIRAFFHCLSFFGHGTGVLIASAVVFVLDSRRRAMQMAGAAMLTGTVTSMLKVATCRPRPFAAFEPVADPALQEAMFNSHLQSFPSGHTATAFVLGVALAHFYPKGRFLFLSMALIVGIQRVTSSNHYPSDVIVGAAIGSIISVAVISLVSATSDSTCHTQVNEDVPTKETRAA